MYKEIIKIGDKTIIEDNNGIKYETIYTPDLNEKLTIQNNIETLENKRSQNEANAINLSKEVDYYKKELKIYKICQILATIITFVIIEVIPSSSSILIDILMSLGIYEFIEIFIYPIKENYKELKKSLYAYKSMDKYLEDDIVKEKVKLKELANLKELSFDTQKIDNKGTLEYNKKYDDMYNYYMSDDALITDTKVKKLTRYIK